MSLDRVMMRTSEWEEVVRSKGRRSLVSRKWPYIIRDGWRMGRRRTNDVVGAELDFESVFGQSWWDGHDSGIVHQDIQSVIVGEEGFSGSLG